tara:strand:- start:568 stop:2058 length:1491 start_codon:yes stop_codon:yes gene_type:complete
MKYLSICSGIEACSVAWHPLGWEAIGFSEIEDFRAEVLRYHYPEVKNYGDFTKITKETIGGISPDVLVGGTPCATFSIAGLRKGLDEDRGNLALEFIKLIQRTNPTWVIWENVFGVLSSNKGKDFATFLGALAECGYGFAYRVLDTQYVRTQRYPQAIPQRRRRLFVVGHIRDWRYPAEVLFDEEEMSKDFKPSRRKKSQTSKEFREGIEQNDIKEEPFIIRESHTQSNGKPFKNDGSSFTLTASDKYSVTVFETNTPDKTARLQKEDISPTLTAMTGGNRQPCVFVEYKNDYESDEGLIHIADEMKEVTVRKHEVDSLNLKNLLRTHKDKLCLGNSDIAEYLNIPKTTVEHWFRNDKSFSIPAPELWDDLKEILQIETDYFDASVKEFITKEGVFESSKRIYDSKASYPTITASNLMPKIIHEETINTELRQLTPIEAERLQGFPDNYTQIPYKGKNIEDCPTSRRYEAVGRSMSINVMEWLGSRIQKVHEKYQD